MTNKEVNSILNNQFYSFQYEFWNKKKNEEGLFSFDGNNILLCFKCRLFVSHFIIDMIVIKFITT
jgi:hypothetical protein